MSKSLKRPCSPGAHLDGVWWITPIVWHRKCRGLRSGRPAESKTSHIVCLVYSVLTCPCCMKRVHRQFAGCRGRFSRGLPTMNLYLPGDEPRMTDNYLLGRLTAFLLAHSSVDTRVFCAIHRTLRAESFRWISMLSWYDKLPVIGYNNLIRTQYLTRCLFLFLSGARLGTLAATQNLRRWCYWGNMEYRKSRNAYHSANTDTQ